MTSPTGFNIIGHESIESSDLRSTLVKGRSGVPHNNLYQNPRSLHKLYTSSTPSKHSPWMTDRQERAANPSVRVQKPDNHLSYPLYQGQQFAFDQHDFNTQPWQLRQCSQQPHEQYQQPCFDYNPNWVPRSQNTQFGSQHTRNFSASSTASNEPSSPYHQTTSHPFIANLDRSPSSAVYWGDESFTSAFSDKGLLQAYGYAPVKQSHQSPAHAAVKDMAIDHHANNTTTAEDVPDFISSRQSNSSHGRNTPNTPRTMTTEDSEEKAVAKAPTNGIERNRSFHASNGYSRLANSEYQNHRGHVELYRTESAACQDELFNPANFDAAPHPPPQANTSSANPQKDKDLLSPHGNLVNERVRNANDFRSQSPARPASRERSPFRKGAELAPRDDNLYPRSPGSAMPSAASMRQRQKAEADQSEFEKHKPLLKREATKTMSPKDAMLDAPSLETDNTTASLFNDIIPEGYQKHFGGSESYQNNYISGSSQAFGSFVPLNQATNMGGFRGLDLNNWLATPVTNAQTTASQPPFSSQRSDKTPEFPANLTSMESSASDHPPASSQESAVSPPLTSKKPTNTSANTGSYSCAAPGCTQRFDTPAKLQKHKRDFHPTSSSAHPTSASVSLSASAHSSASPSATPSNNSEADSDSEPPSGDALGSALPSSALLARNAQAGPHKCNRLNPTTGKPCNSVFSRPYDLTRHEDTIHNKQKLKVRCQYCREEKTFSRNDALTRHMRVVHPEIEFQGKRGK